MTYAVTLDFHNTIASCETWFELEVRGLLSEFLRWHAQETDRPIPPEDMERAATVYREIRRSVMESGLELTAEECVATGLDRLDIQVAGGDIERGIEELMRRTLYDLAPIPGALELIESLRDSGVRLGIVSSAVYHPFLTWSLESFGVLDAFDSVVTSASAGFYKSRTEIYTRALEQLGVDPDRAVHVGDSWRWDAGTAQKAGMKTVWLNATNAEADVTPDLVIGTLHDAAPAILGLIGRTPKSER